MGLPSVNFDNVDDAVIGGDCLENCLTAKGSVPLFASSRIDRRSGAWQCGWSSCLPRIMPLGVVVWPVGFCTFDFKATLPILSIVRSIPTFTRSALVFFFEFATERRAEYVHHALTAASRLLRRRATGSDDAGQASKRGQASCPAPSFGLGGANLDALPSSRSRATRARRLQREPRSFGSGLRFCNTSGVAGSHRA